MADFRFSTCACDMDDVFGRFLQALHRKLEEHSQLATDNRRHEEGSAGVLLRPIPLATSLPTLRRDVEWQMSSNPELEEQLNSGAIQIPSLAALAARMQPSHPSRLSVDRCRGTLPIKWEIQRRTLRQASQDADYVWGCPL